MHLPRFILLLPSPLRQTAHYQQRNAITPLRAEAHDAGNTTQNTLHRIQGESAAFLGQAEARDKICRAIQYGSKFISAGEAGVAREVDKSTSLARKVFRLMKSINELEALLTPAAKSTPLPVVLLAKTKSSLMATFLALDQIVWAGRTGIYKNKERTERISKISLYCFLGGCSTSSLLEFIELLRVARKKHSAEEPSESQALQKQIEQRLLLWIKSSLDVVVAIGLLQLAPEKITPRVTGGFGFVTSLISCYQLLPTRKAKSS